MGTKFMWNNSIIWLAFASEKSIAAKDVRKRNNFCKYLDTWIKLLKGWNLTILYPDTPRYLLGYTQINN